MKKKQPVKSVVALKDKANEFKIGLFSKITVCAPLSMTTLLASGASTLPSVAVLRAAIFNV